MSLGIILATAQIMKNGKIRAVILINLAVEHTLIEDLNAGTL